MELLRVDSQDELSALIRAFKYHWTDVGEEVYVDGFKNSDNKWIFLANEIEIDRKVLNSSYIDYNYGNCLTFRKGRSELYLSTSNFKPKSQFVCQKVTPDIVENEPLNVDVQTLLLEKIGTYTEYPDNNPHGIVQTFFLGRSYSFSSASASSFCKSFDMNLVSFNSKEKLEAVMKRILRKKNRANKDFHVGGSRSTYDENLPLIKPSFENDFEECLSVTTSTKMDNNQIYDVKCSSGSGFICEKIEILDSYGSVIAILPEETPVRTIGLKLLGVMLINCKYFKKFKKFPI